MTTPHTNSAPMPQGGTLYFDSSEHVYWDNLPDGPDKHWYTSVTGLIKAVTPEFDAVAVSEKVAAKRGVDAAALRAEWDAKRDYSCEFGTRVHAAQEAMMLGRVPTSLPRTEREAAIFASGARAVVAIKGAGWIVVAVEMLVAAPAWGIAGTIDLLAQKPTGEYVILDWKSNETIAMDNPYGGRMLSPVKELHDCEFAKYALQMSTYEFILRNQWYISDTAPVCRRIVHLTPEGHKMIDAGDHCAAASRLVAWHRDKLDAVRGVGMVGTAVTD